jgi:sigma-B regulation protein RsbU (phosphoserine phosphatase)
METRILARVKRSLLEKRQNLADWLDATPTTERKVRLGPANETALQAHVQVVDSALQKTEEGTLGRCEVCHECVESGRLQLDYTACVCLDHFSAEEKRRFESGLELSQVVQRSFLPQTVPEIPGWDVAVVSRPAQILGGDYFDFARFRDGAPGLAIADAAGHGVSASLLTASARTAVRTLVPQSDWPSEVLQRVNGFFLHNVEYTTFVTMFLGRFDTKGRTLTYCNAGHNPPSSSGNSPTGARCHGSSPLQPATGLVEQSEISSATISLAGGDALLLYTDGITEATNPQQEEFGPQRLTALVGQESGLSAEDVVEAVRRGLGEFTGGQALADDATLVVCRIDDGFGSS